MADRATYLARRIVNRLTDLEAALLDDAGADAELSYQAGQRTDAVAKVLAVEEGITDGAVVALVLSAAPQVPPVNEPTDVELDEYAEFLRRQLKIA